MFSRISLWEGPKRWPAGRLVEYSDRRLLSVSAPIISFPWRILYGALLLVGFTSLRFTRRRNKQIKTATKPPITRIPTTVKTPATAPAFCKNVLCSWDVSMVLALWEESQWLTPLWDAKWRIQRAVDLPLWKLWKGTWWKAVRMIVYDLVLLRLPTSGLVYKSMNGVLPMR